MLLSKLALKLFKQRTDIWAAEVLNLFGNIHKVINDEKKSNFEKEVLVSNKRDNEIYEFKNMDLGKQLEWILQQAKFPMGFDHTQENNFDNVGKRLIDEHMKLRFQNKSTDELVRLIHVFLSKEVRLKLFALTNEVSFHETIPKLKRAARTLVNMEYPEVREWAVDLLGMVASNEDINVLIGFANNDPEPKVRKEATAALTKYLMYRNDVNGEIQRLIESQILYDDKNIEVKLVKNMLNAQVSKNNS